MDDKSESTESNFDETQDIANLHVKELKALCKNKGIRGYSKLKKQDLLSLLGC